MNCKIKLVNKGSLKFSTPALFDSGIVKKNDVKLGELTKQRF
jgi:hypothetical protein